MRTIMCVPTQGRPSEFHFLNYSSQNRSTKMITGYKTLETQLRFGRKHQETIKKSRPFPTSNKISF